jgi:hypothetical protein
MAQACDLFDEAHPEPSKREAAEDGRFGVMAAQDERRSRWPKPVIRLFLRTVLPQ